MSSGRYGSNYKAHKSYQVSWHKWLRLADHPGVSFWWVELASDSEDEKRIYRSERRAERKVKQNKRNKKEPFNGKATRNSCPNSWSSLYKYNPDAANQFKNRSCFRGAMSISRSFRLGPCFTLSVYYVLILFCSVTQDFLACFVLPSHYGFTPADNNQYSPWNPCFALLLVLVQNKKISVVRSLLDICFLHVHIRNRHGFLTPFAIAFLWRNIHKLCCI